MTQVLIEMPELLHEALKSYLEQHSKFTTDEIITMSVSLFLLEGRGQTVESRALARTYLDTLLGSRDQG
jgi:hypothetical protein